MQNYNIASILILTVLEQISYSTTQSYYGLSEEDSAWDSYDPETHSGRVGNVEPHPPGPLNLRGTLRTRFALDAALANPERSLVCSPLSALLPLGKLALGATGKCLKQLLSAIGLSMSQVKYFFKPLLNDLALLEGVTLDVISKIYISNEHRLKSEFDNSAKEIFLSSVEAVNFEKPHIVASNVNNWVSTKTQNMIPNIISDSDITPWTSLIVVNAVYFSGKWLKSFRLDKQGTFYSPSGVRKVPMMLREGVYNYSKSDTLDAQIIDIPYEGEQASFVIILPNSKKALSIMLEKIRIAPQLLQKAMTTLTPTDVVLRMPKFKISSELDLNVAYKEIGVADIFLKDASGLENIVTGMQNIYVSKAVQKAVIEVSEHGTKAVGSSAILNGQKSLNTIFNANHPFMYFIKYKDIQIFAGTYVE